jgi:hexokinase
MTDTDEQGLPEVVKFIAGGVECVAFILFDHYGLNMRTCLVNFKEKPTTNIEYLPDRARVTINDGQLWFDTTEQSAAEIEYLFESGKAP